MIGATRLVAALVLFVLLPSAVGAGYVDPDLRARAAEEPVRFLVVLEDRADLSAAAGLREKTEKGRAVFAALTATAARSQEEACARLEELGVEYRAFWIVNVIAAEGDARVMDAVASARGVARVVPDAPGRTPEPVAKSKPVTAPLQPEGWGVHKVRAPEVWERGIDGSGVVVGSVDTGGEWDHPELKDKYRGWNGESVSHDYHWFDGVPESADSCPGASQVPCDTDGHGTHTIGTMIGGDGDFSTIGVAPGAQWIACRAWEPEKRTWVSYLLTCLQFMLAPTDLAGENPRPELAPHVMNHSWFCEPVEGCEDPEVLHQAFTNLRTAGIMQVGSAGNDGASCASIKYPPPIYLDFFSVGATQGTDVIATFSSRGPVTLGGELFLKPNVSAPGVNILSANREASYASWSGTSMAGPHVAGAVALLIQADPSLAGDVDRLEDVLEESAVRLTQDNQVCGNGWDGRTIPNIAHGWGRIDVMAAYQAVLGVPVIPDTRTPVVHLTLGPNVPNPIRTATRIPYTVGRAGHVRMEIFDVTGRSIRTLLDDPAHEAGDHAIGWNARDENGSPVASGIYLVRLSDVHGAAARRLVVSR